ncbi:hypothetical protein CYL17_02450 [Thermobispora bispora]|nr:hypothetical protein CYL17_02450 [Thermobispora bispora]
MPRASDEPPDSTHDLETLCWYQRRYYPTVDAYQGPAPHPIQIFEESDSQVSDPGWSPARVRQSLPKHWNRKHDDPTSVQLVACVEIADEGPRIGECRFRGRPIPMYQGRYRATLYEVRTGEKVAEVDDILGRKDFEESMCPAMHVWREDKEPRLLSTPDAAEYQRVSVATSTDDAAGRRAGRSSAVTGSHASRPHGATTAITAEVTRPAAGTRQRPPPAEPYGPAMDGVLYGSLALPLESSREPDGPSAGPCSPDRSATPAGRGGTARSAGR